MNVPSSWCNSWKAGDNHKLEEKVASEVNGIEEFMDMISNTRIDGLSQLTSDSLMVFASAVAAWTLRESLIVFVFGKSG
jgi:hypothetical protein